MPRIKSYPTKRQAAVVYNTDSITDLEQIEDKQE